MDINQDLHIEHKKEKTLIACGILALALIILIVLFVYTRNNYFKIDELKAPLVNEVNRPNPFETLKVTAKSAVVWDVKNQKFIFTKNEQDILPLASLTKLMTALSAAEILPDGSTIKIAQEYLVQEELNSYAELYANESWDANDLIALTLLSSSNAGARAIATASGAFLAQNNSNNQQTRFVDYMNDRADKLNLDSMKFYNDSGLDVSETQSGAYGNAKDVATLTDYIVRNHPELFEATKYSRLKLTSENNLTHDVRNTNLIIEKIPGVIGSKTGYTDLAQGNLVVTFAPGLEGPYVAVVLGSSFDGRFTDMKNIVNATLEFISRSQ